MSVPDQSWDLAPCEISVSGEAVDISALADTGRLPLSVKWRDSAHGFADATVEVTDRRSVKVSLPPTDLARPGAHIEMWFTTAIGRPAKVWRAATLVEVGSAGTDGPAFVLAATLDGDHGGWKRGAVALVGQGYRTLGTDGLGVWKGSVSAPGRRVLAAEAVVLGRGTRSMSTSHVNLEAGGDTCSLSVVFDWSPLAPRRGTETFDPSVILTLDDGSVVRCALPAPSTASLESGRVAVGQSVVYVDPYRTFRASRLAVRTTTVSRDTHDVIEQARTSSRYRRRRAESATRPLWVLGETSLKGQDTAFHLFSYMVEHRPDIDVRFVIDEDSPDRPLVESIGPVLISGSPQHVTAVLNADRIVCSHHPDYLYPVRTPWFRELVGAPRIFIQHGVLGTKWMANLYGRGVGDFVVDHVLVSSQREHDIVVRDLGYARRQVSVTGLSRFDSLLAGEETVGRLVVLPTWRDWIVTDADFRASDFLAQWRSLLESQELHSIARSHGLHVVAMVHPNFAKFAHELSVRGVKTLVQSEVSVHEVLKTSDVLVTDYSSVGFDFALLGRPVFYFQFDRDRFLGREGSHIDLDHDLPGPVSFTCADLVATLTAHLSVSPAEVSAESLERAQAFFPALDMRSRERIVAAIAGVSRQWPGAGRPRWDRAVRRVLGRWRRAIRAIATR